MSSTFSVYCSGSIAKGASDIKKLCWTDAERADVAGGADPHSVVFLNPDDPIVDAANTLGQFGRDMYQVMSASAVIVDARERRGIGIGVEMAAAASMGTPRIVVAPRNTQYRMDNVEYRGVVVADYVHPHVYALASSVVDDFTAAGEALTKLPAEASRRALVPSWLHAAIEEYESNVLPKDEPMLTALEALGVGVLTQPSE